jgi:tRNA nucleotidyltransferase/poly(A) polymerase
VGAAFGVVAVIGGRNRGQIDVATFRSDVSYSDGRRPDRVVFTSAQEDAARRDFTINGLFYDPLAETVIDYVGGQSDLTAGLVRAIGNPRERFGEDKLRMLRAVRFAATFGFEIEAQTSLAIADMAAQITVVSAERIGMEIRRMLTHENRARAVRLLEELRLLSHVLPEVAELSAEELTAAVQALERVGQVTLPLSLAMLVHSSNQPAVADSIGGRLRLTNKETERIRWLVSNLPAARTADELPWPQLQRLLVHEGANELVSLLGAVVGRDHPATQRCHDCLSLPPEQLNPRPLVDGLALIEHGLEAGPVFAVLLNEVRDAQLLGKINSREAALMLVDEILSRGLDGVT